MVKYKTKEGDILDWICWRHYGTTAVLEDVLRHNSDISDVFLKADVSILLPNINLKELSQGITLWK